MKDRIGWLAWLAGALQFFSTHAVVEAVWPRPYSWARNNISDLGNVYCTTQSQPEPRYVCSPAHDAMNLSFIALGALLAVGVVLGRSLWRGRWTAKLARFLLAGAGIGFVLAGLAPADVNENSHVLGALLIMGTGNLGLLLAGAGMSGEVAAGLRWATALLGALAITAMCLFLFGNYLGLGMGGMERVAAFPILVWTLTAGALGLLRKPRIAVGERKGETLSKPGHVLTLASQWKLAGSSHDIRAEGHSCPGEAPLH
ncbi:DUF998 domain-containing protein [Streptomyces sp. NPDC004629]|uniref:DUF998 domain-containing protein n=1 Tax=Streptomyces sp. NPDC004629 TaxID=3364705 RepID=UPI003674C6E3